MVPASETSYHLPNTYLRGGGVGVVHHTMHTCVGVSPCVPSDAPLEVLQRMPRSTTLKTVTRIADPPTLRWSETTLDVLMGTCTTMYGIPYPILHPLTGVHTSCGPSICWYEMRCAISRLWVRVRSGDISGTCARGHNGGHDDGRCDVLYPFNVVQRT